MDFLLSSAREESGLGGLRYAPRPTGSGPYGLWRTAHTRQQKRRAGGGRSVDFQL